MKKWLIGTSLAMTVLAGGPAVAEGLGNRPIQMVVPFPPGGNIDVTARIIAQPLSEILGQNVVVENRPGAGGTIGASAVARSKPDGHTLLVAGSTVSIAPYVYRNAGFDPTQDLTFLGGIQSVPVVLIAHPSFPVDSYAKLREHAGKQPDSLTTATSGNGSAPHLALARITVEDGLKFVHVPYRGGAPALSDLVGGHVNLMVDQLNTSLPYIQDGRVKAIVQLGKERSPLLPNVPTLAESGVADFDYHTYVGLFGPSGLPAKAEEQLVNALQETLRRPEVRAQFEKIGARVFEMDQKQFVAFVNADIAKTKEVVKAAGITVD